MFATATMSNTRQRRSYAEALKSINDTMAQIREVHRNRIIWATIDRDNEINVRADKCIKHLNKAKQQAANKGWEIHVLN